MKKYKVLKSWFAAKEGTELHIDETYPVNDLRNGRNELILPARQIKEALEKGWIEEIKENERYRAKEYDSYFYIGGTGTTVERTKEERHQVDDEWHAMGNYFKSKETAELVAESLKLFFEWIHDREDKPELTEKWQTRSWQAHDAVFKDNEDYNESK